jgi:serine protease AprX
MRRWGLRRATLVATALAVAACAPGTASATNPWGPKVDDALGEYAAALAPFDPLKVILYGSDLAGVNKKLALAPSHVLDSITAESVTIAQHQLDDVAAQKGVAYVHADPAIEPTALGYAEPTASIINNFYPLVDRATWAWENKLRGEGIGIAVVDSGVVPDDEWGTRMTQPTLDGQSAGHTNDEVGHGTFVTSIAAGASPDGRYAGIAHGARLFGINVAYNGAVYTSDVLAGLQWVLKKNDTKKNIRVVVLALQEAVPNSYQSSALDAMVEKLWRNNIVVVVAAGNRGPGAALYAPANDPFAITVGAYDANGTLDYLDDAETSWSTSGTTQDGFGKPDLLAPGRFVTGLLPSATSLGAQLPPTNVVEPGYARLSGTSFAAPQVAAAAALLLQAHPTWTPDQVKWVLKATARPVPFATAGALDVEAALAYAGEPPAANEGIAHSSYALPTWVTTDYRTASAKNDWKHSTWTHSTWTHSTWTHSTWTIFG